MFVSLTPTHSITINGFQYGVDSVLTLGTVGPRSRGRGEVYPSVESVVTPEIGVVIEKLPDLLRNKSSRIRTNYLLFRLRVFPLTERFQWVVQTSVLGTPTDPVRSSDPELTSTNDSKTGGKGEGRGRSRTRPGQGSRPFRSTGDLYGARGLGSHPHPEVDR